ncbi:MAG: hypothetical protein NWE99_02805 [Candidatus Bathyarchaeota archaeon]|nr:hypothetical protein [Candidatus Bathyarchaeota archaeon]
MRVFSTKKEAIECAKQLAKDTADQIDVVSKEGLIARANYDDLRTDGVLFREKDC